MHMPSFTEWYETLVTEECPWDILIDNLVAIGQMFLDGSCQRD
jgi:hypothetical protein